MEVSYRTAAQRKALVGKAVRAIILDAGGWYTYERTGTVDKTAGGEIKIDGDWLAVSRIQRLETVT